MIRDHLLTILKGIAQLAFSDSSRGGGLLLAGLFLVAPQAGVGALVGAAMATLIHRFVGAYSDEEWRLGLSGYNGAVTGILWSGMLSGSHQILLMFFPLAMLLCIALEWLFRKLSQRVLLPVLTLPAVLGGWLVAAVFSSYGISFWRIAAPEVAADPEVLLGILLIISTLSLTDVAASMQAVVLGLVAGLLAHWHYGLDFMALSGFWGFTVAAASFGVQAVFFRGATSAVVAGLIAALAGGGVWLMWMSAGISLQVPPLLAPFILGTWCVLLLARRIDLSTLYLSPLRIMRAGHFRGH